MSAWKMHGPRPDGCCGVCPPIVSGGYDCTCDDNPRCKKQSGAVGNYSHLMVDADQVHTGYVIPADSDLDIWLAQVKAEAQVEVLREAAEEVHALYFGGSPTGSANRWGSKTAAARLRARADRIAREAGIETGEK